MLVPWFPVRSPHRLSALWFSPLVFFPFTVLFNAVVLNLLLPVAFFISNLIKGNKAPLPYLFLGYPVKGETIADEFGIVMEHFEETDGTLQRSFIPVRAAIKDMLAGGKRVYTKSLKENSAQYRKELELYKKAGTVYISYGGPFLIPITIHVSH